MKPALHLLFLPAETGQTHHELFVDARGLRVEGLPPGAPVERVLVVPSQDLVLERVVAAAASAAQARAAAWHALDGRLAAPPGSLEWVVADAAADGSRWVAGFTSEARNRWLDAAAGLGFVPGRIVPDCLLLPEPATPGDWVVCDGPCGSRLARDAGQAFAAEAGLAQIVLQGKAQQRVGNPDAAALLLRGAGDAGLPDLSPGTARRGSEAPPVPLRRLLALAAALVLSPLAIWTAQGVRHELAAARLDAAADTHLRSVAPGASGPGRPLPRAQAALAERRSPDRFGQLAAALLQAQSQVPGSRLQSIELQADGVLEVRWQHGPKGLPSTLGEALAAHGVAVAETGTQTGASTAVTTLLLSELP